MIRKRILVPERIRHIHGGFGFIPHRFMADGFLATLGREELLLYFFLVVASDKHGLSYYGSKRICSLLDISESACQQARDQLIMKDLIAYDGTLFQLLSLPDKGGR
jgi:hypothetical protein